MKIEIVLAPTTAQAVLPPAHNLRYIIQLLSFECYRYLPIFDDKYLPVFFFVLFRAPAHHHHNNSSSHNNQRSQGARGARGARGGRGGRGGRNSGEKRETKTAEQLDAEMNDYMQVDA